MDSWTAAWSNPPELAWSGSSMKPRWRRGMSATAGQFGDQVPDPLDDPCSSRLVAIADRRHLPVVHDLPRARGEVTPEADDARRGLEVEEGRRAWASGGGGEGGRRQGGRVRQLVALDEGSERARGAGGAQLPVGDVVGEGRPPPARLEDFPGGHEQELGFRVDEAGDQPGTGDAIDPRAFTCDPFHDGSS